MSTSTVPATIDALVAALDGAIDGVDVHDGPPVRYVNASWVAVGYSPVGEDVTAVENWTQETRGLGQQGREERYDVVCSLGSSTGGMQIKPLRDHVFALLGLVETTLRTNPTLGTARFVELTSGTYTQERPEDESGRGSGLTAGIDFRISVQARV